MCVWDRSCQCQSLCEVFWVLLWLCMFGGSSGELSQGDGCCSVYMGLYFPARLCVSELLGRSWLLLSLSMVMPPFWHVLVTCAGKSWCMFRFRNFALPICICLPLAFTSFLAVAASLCLETPICMVRDLPTRHFDNPVSGKAVTIVVCCSPGAVEAYRPISL